MMKILILGGSGFVSGTLARTARDLGYGVWVVTRGRKPLPEGVTSLRADRKDTEAFKGVVASAGVTWDLVVDCIGFDLDDMRQDLQVFPGLAGHFIFISTDFVFDPARRCFPQPADNPATLSDDSYGGRKRSCELELIRTDTGDMQWTVFRPCHIYGPGSSLGCLPGALRDPDLLERIRAGEALRLVGGGHFLQQPVFAPDLAGLILSAAGNPMANRRIYMSAGPEIAESAAYYRMIAEALGTGLRIEEVPVTSSLEAHPEWKPYLCHRIYDQTPLRLDALKTPNTPLREGLRRHVRWLESQHQAR